MRGRISGFPAWGIYTQDIQKKNKGEAVFLYVIHSIVYICIYMYIYGKRESLIIVRHFTKRVSQKICDF